MDCGVNWCWIGIEEEFLECERQTSEEMEEMLGKGPRWSIMLLQRARSPRMSSVCCCLPPLLLCNSYSLFFMIVHLVHCCFYACLINH